MELLEISLSKNVGAFLNHFAVSIIQSFRVKQNYNYTKGTKYFQ